MGHAQRAVAILVALRSGLSIIAVWRAPEVAAWRWYFNEGKPSVNSGPLELAGPLRWFDGYYAVADLGQNRYAIGEPHYGQCNFSYLIVGSKRALLLILLAKYPWMRPSQPTLRSEWRPLALRWPLCVSALVDLA